jgi:phosphoglycolate phosphatase
MAELAIEPGPACVVSGDTVAHSKPHPAPLHHAAEQVGANPARCVYVGDAPRDIDAAVAAGMIPVVAGWGYLPADIDPGHWGAQAVTPTPAALRDWLMDHLSREASANVG